MLPNPRTTKTETDNANYNNQTYHVNNYPTQQNLHINITNSRQTQQLHTQHNTSKLQTIHSIIITKIKPNKPKSQTQQVLTHANLVN